MTQSFVLHEERPKRFPIRCATILIFAFATTLPGPALAQSSEPTFGAVIASCEACHGAGGNSRDAEIPRLNGQRIDYMMGRLDILGNPLQSVHPNDAMWRIVSDMNTNVREDIVKYFAAQTPMTASADVLGTQGREIYEHGIPGEGVLACSLCHGAVGQGQDLAPRIAGQDRNYLKAQILKFNSAARPHGTMNSDEHKLTGDQLEAVLDYLGNG